MERKRIRRVIAERMAARSIGIDPKVERIWAGQVAAIGTETHLAQLPDNADGSPLLIAEDGTPTFIFGVSDWGGSDLF